MFQPHVTHPAPGAPDMPTVVISTVGGGSTGMGHVIRSLALADALSRFTSVAIDVSASPSVAPVILAARIPVRTDPPETPPPVWIRDFPVHDSPAPLGAQLTVDICDSSAERSRCADLTFAVLGHDGYTAEENVYAGLPFAILRPQFREWRARRPEFGQRRRPVITLGGVDPSCSTDALFVYLTEHGIPVTALVTPQFAQLPQLPHPTTFTIWAELAAASCAITSAGTTLLECACLGVPAIAISHNAREHARMLEYAARFPAWYQYAGPAAELDLSSPVLAALVRHLSQSRFESSLYGSIGASLVDGHGTMRVVNVVLGAMSARGIPA